MILQYRYGVKVALSLKSVTSRLSEGGQPKAGYGGMMRKIKPSEVGSTIAVDMHLDSPSKGEILRGIGVSPGRVVGRVVRMPEPILTPAAGPAPSDLEIEAARIAPAAASVAKFLEARAESAVGEAANILMAQSMMATDEVLTDGAEELVRSDGVRAEYALWQVCTRYRESLAELGGYLAERQTDLDDVRDRIVAELLGVPARAVPERDHPFVLVARDLAPADTVSLKPELVLGFVTERGGPTSHTAILAHSLGIPAVVNCDGAKELADDTTVLVDGASGEVLVDPTPESARGARRQPVGEGPVEALSADAGRTSDGVAFFLLANVSGVDDMDTALVYGAQGVGLLRTELLFMGRRTPPSIGEQAEAYRQIFARAGSRKVILRTLDAGGDKPLLFLPQGDEPNPALGIRGLRISRVQKAVLIDQLAAVALAAAGSNAEVCVMAPMIATVQEAEDFVGAAVETGLTALGVRVGVMVEVPAAAVMAQRILPVVDFASIGTNDLAQYTMAADRMLGPLADLNDPWQPAVLQMIASTCNAGMSCGRPVGVCGEAAADPAIAAVLVGLGVRSLSMAPRRLAAVNRRLASLSLEFCQTLASLALEATRASDARAAVIEALAECERWGS